MSRLIRCVLASAFAFAASAISEAADSAPAASIQISFELHELDVANQIFAVVDLAKRPPLFGRGVHGIIGNTFIDYAERTLA